MKKLTFALCFMFSINLNAEAGILAFSGSAREDSLNKKLILETARLASELDETVEVIDLKDYPMPFYNADLEALEGMPLYAKKFKQMMIQNDVIIIATPEYNGSIPAILKNTIDWATRQGDGPTREAFKGKKFIIMSASPGSGGGKKVLLHLRQIIEHIGGTVILKQISVPDAENAFDGEGCIRDDKLKNYIKEVVRDTK